MGGGEGLTAKEVEFVYIITGRKNEGGGFIYTVSQAHRHIAEDISKLSKEIDTTERQQNESKARILKERYHGLKMHANPVGTFDSGQFIKLDTIIKKDQYHITPVRTKQKH
jgi:hypothetical protein